MKKNFKYFLLSLLVCASFIMPVTGCSCSNPAEDAANTVEGMASQEDKAQDALDAFHSDADAKDADYEKNPKAYTITKKTVKAGQTLKLTEARGGGFAISLIAK